MNIAQHILIGSIGLYRTVLSPAQRAIFGPTAGCRYSPSCSVYAMDAVRKHGALKGSLLAGKRLCRCHPWGGCGEDPVPEQYSIHIPGIRFFSGRPGDLGGRSQTHFLGHGS